MQRALWSSQPILIELDLSWSTHLESTLSPCCLQRTIAEMTAITAGDWEQCPPGGGKHTVELITGVGQPTAIHQKAKAKNLGNTHSRVDSPFVGTVLCHGGCGSKTKVGSQMWKDTMKNMTTHPRHLKDWLQGEMTQWFWGGGRVGCKISCIASRIVMTVSQQTLECCACIHTTWQSGLLQCGSMLSITFEDGRRSKTSEHAMLCFQCHHDQKHQRVKVLDMVWFTCSQTTTHKMSFRLHEKETAILEMADLNKQS